jgi:hypothetical protein
MEELAMDLFSNHLDALDAPARRTLAVVPSDTAPLPRLTRALYVGSGGSVVVRAADAAEDCIFANVPSGAILPLRISHVRATGTSAGSLVALD